MMEKIEIGILLLTGILLLVLWVLNYDRGKKNPEGTQPFFSRTNLSFSLGHIHTADIFLSPQKIEKALIMICDNYIGEALKILIPELENCAAYNPACEKLFREIIMLENRYNSIEYLKTPQIEESIIENEKIKISMALLETLEILSKNDSRK